METVYEFWEANERMPLVERGEEPWKYRGWMRLMVQYIQASGRIANRWGYFAQCVSSGKLPDEPIPQINFAECADPEGMKQIERAVDRIAAAGHHHWAAFERFVHWIGFGLDIPSYVNPGLSEEVNEDLYRNLNFESWLLHPYDYLGDFAAQRMGKGKAWNPNSFFPTPMSIVKMMVTMTMGDEINGGKDTRMLTVCDPCVGSGRFLLVASNWSMFLTGVDIDDMMVEITNINGILYAPWICYPPPIEKSHSYVLTGRPKKKVPPKRTARKKLPPKRTTASRQKILPPKRR